MLNYVGEDACFIRFSPSVLESVDFIVISLSFSLIMHIQHNMIMSKFQIKRHTLFRVTYHWKSLHITLS